MSYPYGQAFTAYFYPLVDDAAYVPTLTTGNLVSAYLFDVRPGLAEAASGAGAVLGVVISGWTWDAAKGAFAIAVPAVDDPEPTGTYSVENTYFLAVNWRLEAGEQVQTTLQAITLERPRGHTTALTVMVADLRNLYRDIEAYGDEPQLLSAIALAKDDVRDKLLARGYRWANVTRPDRLKQVVVLKAVALVMLGEAQAGNDKFFAKYAEYKGLAKDALDGLQVEYDATGDGVPDAPDATGGGSGIQTLFVVR